MFSRVMLGLLCAICGFLFLPGSQEPKEQPKVASTTIELSAVQAELADMLQSMHQMDRNLEELSRELSLMRERRESQTREEVLTAATNAKEIVSAMQSDGCSCECLDKLQELEERITALEKSCAAAAVQARPKPASGGSSGTTTQNVYQSYSTPIVEYVESPSYTSSQSAYSSCYTDSNGNRVCPQPAQPTSSASQRKRVFGARLFGR